MIELRPCARCQRHVRATDVVCVFCGGSLVRARGPVSIRGPWSRAAVFTSITLGACWTRGSDSTPAEHPRVEQHNKAAPRDPAKGRVEGVVRGTPSKRPLAGVTISFSLGKVPITTTTDAQGRYSVELLPGEYTVDYVAPGTQSWATIVMIRAGEVKQADAVISELPPPVVMPYGAPPVRRRVV